MLQQEKKDQDNKNKMMIAGAVIGGLIAGFALFSSSNGSQPPTSQMFTKKK